ncbi:MAG: DUF4474 domain-containing protein [Anaerostipes sp.]|nr:DUF4474 domain-containing protein [Anaerostipes sp.]MDD3747712.1 DUF4474 domain-containing protein [Anaerostipes sp.]
MDEVTNYSYDKNGNEISQTSTKTGETLKRTYDAKNQLSTVSKEKDGQSTLVQSNDYNGDGQRIQKTEGGNTTNYYYQDGVVSSTTDGSGTQTSQNLIGLEGNVIGTERYTSDTTSYYSYNKDIQGSTTSLIKEDGTADATYTYTDFGETRIQGDNTAGNEVCYTGGVYDSTTGLYYLNARYYNPEDGRFLTEDTYRGESTEPDTQNLYAYCNGNPVNYVDSSGHKFFGYWSSKQHYFAFNQNAPQKYLGYNNAYDYAANSFGMDIKYKKYITAHWRLEFWKGKYGEMYGYGISSGCEIGLYYRGWSKNPQWSCAYQKNKRLRMSLALYTKENKKLFSRDSKNTTKQGKAWWLTGFQPGKFQPGGKTRGKNSLRMKGLIYFTNKKSMKGLYEKFKTNGSFKVSTKDSRKKIKSFDWQF